MATTKVVILNWNGREYLRRFLPSVVASAPEGVEVVVADNGSTDDSCDFVGSHFPGVTLLRLADNYGYAEGYNRALSDGMFDRTDCFVLLNSDVETPRGWLEPLISKLESDTSIAAVSPKILSYSDRSMFEYAGACGGFIDALGYPFCRGRIMSSLELDSGQYDDSRGIFWASGACFAVRADVFRELGGFDADFFAHMEEIDFCWRAQLRGWKIVVKPASAVYHLGAGTLQASDPRKTYLNYRNNLAMLYKNLSRRSRIPMIFTRMALDGVSAAAYLFSGRPELFKAVWRAHGDYRKWKPALKEKRRQIQNSRVSDPQYIYKGSVIIRFLFGKRKFGEMM